MNKKLAFALLLAVIVAVIISSYMAAQEDQPKRLAVITIDDLPVVYPTTPDSVTMITEKLLAHLTNHNIESIGFVNEGKAVDSPHPEALQKALELWLENGQELANHTYSHCSLSEVSADSFQNDILLCEKHLKPLVEKYDQKLRYFRHPYLQTGNDTLKKEQVDRFLEAKGYTQAPVTAGYLDWLYATAYRNADGNDELQTKVADAYIAYMDRDLAFNEYAAKEIVGKEVPMILLFHANTLNADHFDRVIDVIHKRGYEIVTMEEALKDPVFEIGNPIVSEQSMGWLQRWAVHKGIAIDTVPFVDPFIPELANYPLN